MQEGRQIPEGHQNSNIENKLTTSWLNKTKKNKTEKSIVAKHNIEHYRRSKTNSTKKWG